MAGQDMNVVFLCNVGFPSGMAATQRIRLLSKALVGKGVQVTILCLDAFEDNSTENIQTRGMYEGINFEYTPGTNLRAKSFFMRRWLDLKGKLRATWKLMQLKKSNQLDGVYLWITIQNITFWGIFFRLLLWILKVPLFLEINEMPWALKASPNIIERRISPLITARGAITISALLHDWVVQEAKKFSRQIDCTYVPILANPFEIKPLKIKQDHQTMQVLFASSPDYGATIDFILRSMEWVWKRYPECKLILTGIRSNDQGTIHLKNKLIELDIQKKVVLAGYLPRNELLKIYGESQALLIPLFDDVRSKARFPTKLAEYLASGSPVVATKAGEINRFLHDGINAYLSEPNSPKGYGEAIIRALEDPDRALTVGKQGAVVAGQQLDYRLWANSLKDFFEQSSKLQKKGAR